MRSVFGRIDQADLWNGCSHFQGKRQGAPGFVLFETLVAAQTTLGKVAAADSAL